MDQPDIIVTAKTILELEGQRNVKTLAKKKGGGEYDTHSPTVTFCVLICKPLGKVSFPDAVPGRLCRRELCAQRRQGIVTECE